MRAPRETLGPLQRLSPIPSPIVLLLAILILVIGSNFVQQLGAFSLGVLAGLYMALVYVLPPLLQSTKWR